MVVRIVTDSTSDIPLEKARALGITIVPLTVFFGEKAYLDGIELDNAAFYSKLRTSKQSPRTSQPPPAAFQEAYTRLINEGADGILSVHISSKLSGTYQSACTGRDTLPEDMKKIPIEIVDSQIVSLGMGVPIMHAAEEAPQGASLAELKTRLLDRIARTGLGQPPAVQDQQHHGEARGPFPDHGGQASIKHSKVLCKFRPIKNAIFNWPKLGRGCVASPGREGGMSECDRDPAKVKVTVWRHSSVSV